MTLAEYWIKRMLESERQDMRLLLWCQTEETSESPFPEIASNSEKRKLGTIRSVAKTVRRMAFQQNLMTPSMVLASYFFGVFLCLISPFSTNNHRSDIHAHKAFVRKQQASNNTHGGCPYLSWLFLSSWCQKHDDGEGGRGGNITHSRRRMLIEVQVLRIEVTMSARLSVDKRGNSSSNNLNCHPNTWDWESGFSYLSDWGRKGGDLIWRVLELPYRLTQDSKGVWELPCIWRLR